MRPIHIFAEMAADCVGHVQKLRGGQDIYATPLLQAKRAMWLLSTNRTRDRQGGMMEDKTDVDLSSAYGDQDHKLTVRELVPVVVGMAWFFVSFFVGNWVMAKIVWKGLKRFSRVLASLVAQ